MAHTSLRIDAEISTDDRWKLYKLSGKLPDNLTVGDIIKVETTGLSFDVVVTQKSVENDIDYDGWLMIYRAVPR